MMTDRCDFSLPEKCGKPVIARWVPPERYQVPNVDRWLCEEHHDLFVQCGHFAQYTFRIIRRVYFLYDT